MQKEHGPRERDGDAEKGGHRPREEDGGPGR